MSEDAGSIDAGSMADPNGGDAGSATDLTTITLRNLKALATPPESILVLVSSPTGEKVDIGLTDVEGKVQLEVPPGSTVTTIAENNYTVDGEPYAYTSIVSLFDVPDADPLYMNIWKTSGDIVTKTGDPIDVTVDLSSSRSGIEGDTGVLDIACNGNRTVGDNDETNGFNTSYALTAIRPCEGTNEIEVWGFARGGWAYGTYSPDPNVKPHLALTANNALWDTSTLYVDGIPDGAGRLNYGVWASMTAGSPGHYVSKSVALPLAQEVLPVEVPRAALHHTSVGASLSIDPDRDVGAYASRTGAVVADLHWNATQDLALIDRLSSVDRQIQDRPAVTWYTADMGKLGDYVEVSLGWRDVQWVAYLPPARAGRVQFPDLPTGPDRFAPRFEDEVYLGGVSMTDDLLVDGYVGFVNQPNDYSENYNQTYFYP